MNACIWNMLTDAGLILGFVVALTLAMLAAAAYLDAVLWTLDRLQAWRIRRRAGLPMAKRVNRGN